jgi:hypothetical protein
MPAAPGPPWSAVEYTSTHPHDVRLRRAQSGGNEVGVRCKTKPRPWGQITTGAVRLLRIGRGCLARRAIVARRKAVVRRNTEEVRGGGNFEVFDELFADDFLDHTPQPSAQLVGLKRPDGKYEVDGETYETEVEALNVLKRQFDRIRRVK